MGARSAKSEPPPAPPDIPGSRAVGTTLRQTHCTRGTARTPWSRTREEGRTPCHGTAVSLPAARRKGRIQTVGGGGVGPVGRRRAAGSGAATGAGLHSDDRPARFAGPGPAARVGRQQFGGRISSPRSDARGPGFRLSVTGSRRPVGGRAEVLRTRWAWANPELEERGDTSAAGRCANRNDARRPAQHRGGAGLPLPAPTAGGWVGRLPAACRSV